MECNLIQLLILQAERYSDLKRLIHDGKCLSREIVNEFIALMGITVLRELLSEIMEVNMFSLLADQASVVSHTEQMSTTITCLLVSPYYSYPNQRSRVYSIFVHVCFIFRDLCFPSNSSLSCYY